MNKLFDALTQDYTNLSLGEKGEAASLLSNLSNGIDEIQEAVTKMGFVSVGVLDDKEFINLTETYKDNFFLQTIVSLFEEATMSLVDFANEKLNDFKLLIQISYSLLLKSELSNWGDPFIGKENPFIPPLISLAQKQILAVLKEHSVDTKQLNERIDFFTDRPKCEDMENLVTTGMDSDSRPFILIKGIQQSTLFEGVKTNENQLIHIQMEFTDHEEEILKAAKWTVKNGDAFFGSLLTTEELAAKLQDFFQKGLEFKVNEATFILQPFNSAN